MASIQDVLRAIVLTKAVSRVAGSSSRLLTTFGMQPGGPLERPVGGRTGQYDVYNNVRRVGGVSAPGTAAKKRARNPVGYVPFVFPRHHDSLHLLAEEIHNFRPIGGPSNVRDEAGVQYIAKQTKTMGQALANWRTAQLVGMLRDSLYIAESGDSWYFTYTSSGSLKQVSYQMPTGNKSQLNMLGNGSIITIPWDNANANIPQNCLDISQAMEQLTGAYLAHIFCNTKTWGYVLTNDYVAAGHGIANTPFTTFRRELTERPDGGKVYEFVGELVTVPGVIWHIMDEGLDIGAPGSETYTKHFPDGGVAFVPEINADMFEILLGSEPIAEYDNAPVQVKMGTHAWSKTTFNPTGVDIFTLDNALTCNYVPSANAYATVTGF